MLSLADAQKEIEANRVECLSLLKRMGDFHTPAEGEPYDPTFRLIATPMLYSAWERCFSLCHEVALRLVRDNTPHPMALPCSTRAVWLLHTPFYKSMADKLKTQVSDSERPKRGQFASLCDFLAELDAWSTKALDPTVSTESMVMTMSNVNPDVVEINAKAIGLYDTPLFQSLRLGKLHDLVGRRNEIGHGGVIEPPSNETFVELWAFTQQMIDAYCAAVSCWMSAAFAPAAATA
ncbi:hypothetical protein [Ideonella sp.]|uniref:hypothetical protein n=1 Tax=Ideonella sp. TaxID=1929293 RepID=UPI0035AF904A